MAQRRMFSLTVIDTDRFIDLPANARLLYYELGMRADDDGFVGAPNKIIRMLGLGKEDLQTLIDMEYLIPFDSGVVAVAHWKQNNQIRKDRYTPTVYQEEKAQLCDDDNISEDDEQTNMTTTRYTQDRIGKDRVGKDRSDQDRSDQDSIEQEKKEKKKTRKTSKTRTSGLAAAALSSFHSFCNTLPKAELTDHRRELVARAVGSLKGTDFDAYFRRVSQSDFLSGRSGKWTGCTFDWLLRPDTIEKVLSGIYDNRSSPDAAVGGQTCSYDIRELEKIDTLDWIE